MREKLKHAYQTERLVLAPVTIDDAPDMFEYASNPENAYMCLKPIKLWKIQKTTFKKYL